MAEPEVRLGTTAGGEADDFPMEGGDVVELNETGTVDAPGEDEEEAAEKKEAATRIAFVEYEISLPSPLHTPK